MGVCECITVPINAPSCRVVPQADKMCRDVVSTPKKDFQSEGKSYKITFLTGSGEPATIDCPDNSYILDAAESQGLDLPATCRGNALALIDAIILTVYLVNVV